MVIWVLVEWGKSYQVVHLTVADVFIKLSKGEKDINFLGVIWYSVERKKKRFSWGVKFYEIKIFKEKLLPGLMVLDENELGGCSEGNKKATMVQ